MHEHTRAHDGMSAQFTTPMHEPITVRGLWRAEYYTGDWTPEQIAAGEAGTPEVYEAENILVNSGIGLLLDLLIGAGGTTYANANTYLGVGDSTTAAAASQTDLVAATNRFKRVMDATFPSRSAQTLTFRTTYATTEANFAIQEAGIFNGGPAFATGTMLNRLVSSLGTKTSTTTLQLTVTVTIS